MPSCSDTDLGGQHTSQNSGSSFSAVLAIGFLLSLALPQCEGDNPQTDPDGEPLTDLADLQPYDIPSENAIDWTPDDELPSDQSPESDPDPTDGNHDLVEPDLPADIEPMDGTDNDLPQDAVLEPTTDPLADLPEVISDTTDSGLDAQDIAPIDQSPDGLTDPEIDAGPEPFPIRVPQSRVVSCGQSSPTFFDIDHVCTIDMELSSPAVSVHADLYIQASPYGCAPWGSPLYTSVGAWMRVDGEVTQLDAGQSHYDYGGNHHNDAIDVVIQGEHLLLYHSSFAWGWRACAPPDCVLVCAEGTEVRRPHDPDQDTSVTCTRDQNYVLDGCERNTGDPPPPHPVLCVEVQADGSVPPLLDPWTSHTEAPDYPLLPCIGDI
ncbi:MAG: hypothetical protein JW797_03005 [Bradymonadales bacterium]|nr:hypothetical protein [Bradymonadales bacterium]